MIGLGLIEAIVPRTILAMPIPTTRNGDGIPAGPIGSGRSTGKLALGRFGWKAGPPARSAAVGRRACQRYRAFDDPMQPAA